MVLTGPFLGLTLELDRNMIEWFSELNATLSEFGHSKNATERFLWGVFWVKDFSRSI